MGKGREFIYSRVSTDGQSVDAQAIALSRRYPCAAMVSETASGGKVRPMLDTLVAQLKSGDTLIVAALDRLGRRAAEVLTLIEDLSERGVILISEREGIDYFTRWAPCNSDTCISSRDGESDDC